MTQDGYKHEEAQDVSNWLVSSNFRSGRTCESCIRIVIDSLLVDGHVEEKFHNYFAIHNALAFIIPRIVLRVLGP
jgi:hypothetical protein